MPSTRGNMKCSLMARVSLLPICRVLFLLLGCTLHGCAAQTPPPPDPPGTLPGIGTLDCGDVRALPQHQRCAAAKDCKSDNRIPWSNLFYCHVQPHGKAVVGLFVTALVIIVLPIMVLLLLDTADMYFGPCTATVSQLTNMRPRVAGVTLLAAGNCAPDISSAVVAMQQGQVSLSLGAIVGAASVVQMLVLSQVILIAGTAKCGISMLRIILFYISAVVLLLCFLASGQISLAYIILALLLYAVFVLSVIFDEQLSRMVRRSRRGFGAMLTHIAKTGSAAEGATGDAPTQDGASSVGGGSRTTSGRPLLASFSWERVKQSLSRRRAERLMASLEAELKGHRRQGRRRGRPVAPFLEEGDANLALEDDDRDAEGVPRRNSHSTNLSVIDEDGEPGAASMIHEPGNKTAQETTQCAYRAIQSETTAPAAADVHLEPGTQPGSNHATLKTHPPADLETAPTPPSQTGQALEAVPSSPTTSRTPLTTMATPTTGVGLHAHRHSPVATTTPSSTTKAMHAEASGMEEGRARESTPGITYTPHPMLLDRRTYNLMAYADAVSQPMEADKLEELVREQQLERLGWMRNEFGRGSGTLGDALARMAGLGSEHEQTGRERTLSARSVPNVPSQRFSSAELPDSLKHTGLHTVSVTADIPVAWAAEDVLQKNAAAIHLTQQLPEKKAGAASATPSFRRSSWGAVTSSLPWMQPHLPPSVVAATVGSHHGTQSVGKAGSVGSYAGPTCPSIARASQSTTHDPSHPSLIIECEAEWDEEVKEREQRREQGRHHRTLGVMIKTTYKVAAVLSLGEVDSWLASPWYFGVPRCIAFLLVLPIYLLMRATIPVVEPEQFSSRWLVLSVFLMPLGFLYYLGEEYYTLFPAIGACVGAGLALVLLTLGLLRSSTESWALPVITLGKKGKADVCALGYCVLGFFASALWIAFVANELVGTITLVAMEIGIPVSLMGMTFLAWGNSMGDYANNVAMARRGVPEMSITAVFAAHIMNLLISTGLGFLLLLQSPGGGGSVMGTFSLTFPPEIAMALALLIVYNIGIIVMAITNKWMFPKKGVVIYARASYLVFCVGAVVLSVLFGK